MNKEEFLKELEYLLQDIPEEEKADALDYYRDYLEEAGEDAQDAIKEFGSPERIAAIIRSDMAGHLEEGGGFTERGYEDERFRDPNYRLAKRCDLPEQSYQSQYSKRDGRAAYRRNEEKRRNSSNRLLKVILVLVVLCVTSPIWLGFGGGVLGIMAGMVSVLAVLLVVVAVLTVVFFVSGIAAFLIGLFSLAANPLGGLLAMGIGLMVIGLGFVTLVIGAQFYFRFLPWVCRGIINFISNLIHRRERAE